MNQSIHDQPRTGRKRLSRRNFLAAATSLGISATLAGPLYPARAWATKQEVEDFFKPLIDAGVRKGPVYEGEHLEHVAFPLGGIGTGSVALLGTGEIGQWQIWNRIHKPARVGQTFFALSVETRHGFEKRVLQTVPIEEVPDLAPMKSLSFRGEYPIAHVLLEDTIPLQIELEATSPMIPLDPHKSAYPLAVFNWKLTNTGDRPVKGILAGSLQNAVGHDGFSTLAGHRFHGYGKSRVVVHRDASPSPATHLFFDCETGQRAAFENPVQLTGNSASIHRALKYTKHSHQDFHPNFEGTWPEVSEAVLREKIDVVWIDRMKSDWGVDPAALLSLARAVQAGTNLVLSTYDSALVQYLLRLPVAEEGSILIEDFESGQYQEGWRIEGEGFGGQPATGTFPGQTQVSGYLGQGLINTFNPDDDRKGKLISPEFEIAKPFLQFLIGGGHHPATQIRLLVEGEIVERASGINTEILKRKVWDVSRFLGKTAHLEIVDEQAGGWGHILVDDIRLSDSRDLFLTRQEADTLRGFLPFEANGDFEWRPLGGSRGEHSFYTAVRPEWFEGLRGAALGQLKPNPDSTVIGTSDPEVPLAVLGKFGEGKVLFLNIDLAKVPPGRIEPIAGGAIGFLTAVPHQPRSGWPSDFPFQGSMALSAEGSAVEALPAWTEPQDLLDFLEGKQVQAQVPLPTPLGESFAGALRVPFDLAPGQSAETSFAFSWYFPNHYSEGRYEPDFRIGNEYNNRFRDALEVARSFCSNREDLLGGTRWFTESFYRSTLPVELLDCVSSQFSILRSQTSMWLEDGTFAGWEGCSVDVGCCPMNCTHVYNYAQAMACLFPSLEREVRAKDLGLQLTPEGLIHHRLQLPLSLPRGSGEALDGQLGTLLKLYREHRRCADDSFLKAWWEPAKKALAYVFKERDPQAEGIIRNRQFNTYDDAVYGINPFIGTLYLAALRAMQEMAVRLGDGAIAGECRARFVRGSKTLEESAWNGEFFIQEGDPDRLEGRNFGRGCLADQVVGQWWAHILDLGYLLPESRVQTALENLFRYNWREKMAGVHQAPRSYAGPDDSGLLNCTWPNGGRPAVPILYCDEVWTGLEYQVAGHFLYEGIPAPALKLIAGARNRSDGVARKGTHPSLVGNPWNEIECGDHYARAMSSYALLLAAQGQTYDGPAMRIGFHPRLEADRHVSFFTGAEGWGTFEQLRAGNLQSESISLLAGSLKLQTLSFSLPAGATALKQVNLKVNGEAREVRVENEGPKATLSTEIPLILSKGDQLRVDMDWA